MPEETDTVQECITGKVSNIIFQDLDTGFIVLNIKTEKGRYQTVTGHNLSSVKNVYFRYIGKTVIKKGRPTFQVATYEDVQKDFLKQGGMEDLVAYISSGLFPGIGTKTARAIVEKFGDQAVSIIENDTSKLIEVKGIASSKVSKLRDAIEKNRFVKELTDELTQYGVSVDQCSKICSIYGHDALAAVRENPYQMIHDIRMSFKNVDDIALRMGIAFDATVRLDAAFKHIMGKAYSAGHTGIEMQSFGKDVYKLLEESVPKSKINARFHDYLRAGWYKHALLDVAGERQKFIFTEHMFVREKEICESIVKMKRSNIEPIRDIKERINAIESAKGIKLDLVQVQAIETGLSEPIMVITGGPGTGKTTIMQFITQIYEDITDDEAALLAPTGRAARRMAECTGHEARTIHSYFNIYNVDSETDDQQVEQSNSGLIIVDEFSMTDTFSAHILLTHIQEGSRVIIVGDTDQLPSVGPGAVLRDIINSGICPVVKLTRIFRTDEKNLIYTNIRNVCEGIKDLQEGVCFHLYKESNMEKCKAIMTELYVKRVAEYGIEETVLLLPYRKRAGGVEDMNLHLQAILNPPSLMKDEVKVNGQIYRVGDPVMHVRHNTPDVANGDTGLVVGAVNMDGNIQVSVRINNQLIVYDRIMLTDLELAYATTIHKSQGSEYKAVITCITSRHSAMLYRNIPYVAFSRGKCVVDVVYDDGLYTAISTRMSNTRITLLPYFLQRAQGNIVYDID